MTLEADTELLADRLGAQEFVEVMAHHSADGLAAGVILGTALWRAGIRFRLRCMGEFSPADLPDEGAIVLCGMGASRTDLPEHVMVVDHHVPHFAGPYQLNPHRAGMDGERELSSAGAAYLVAQHLGDHRDLAGIAVAGMVGEGQLMEGMNREICNEGVALGIITPGRGLRLPGRDVAEGLLLSLQPSLPGITGSEERVKELLARCPGEGGPDTEVLLSLILLEISPHASAMAMASLYGDRHGLEKELIPDAHALAAVLDACGRSGAGGLAAMLGFRTDGSPEQAWEVTRAWRLRVAAALQAATAWKEAEGWYQVADAPTGPGVADALISTMAPARPLVVLAPDGDVIRVSARAIPGCRANLEAALDAAARAHGGRASGNRCSADAVVPAGALEGIAAAFREALAA
ncbi:MAG: phosphoesterase [Methanomicrobiales archaeon]|nr:phosphoesterase [Methanomicrobiales archaeon]